MLKKVDFIMKSVTDKKGFRDLVNILARYGVKVDIVLLSPESMPEWLEKEASGGMLREVLFVTDSRCLIDILLEKGCNVIVYLDESNRQEDFTGVMYALEGFENLDYDYFNKVYERMVGEPWEILETRRCLVREMTEADVGSLQEIYRDPEMIRYTDKLFDNYEEGLTYIRQYTEQFYKFYGFGIWIVLDKRTGRPVGAAGFTWRAGFENAELGFAVAREYQGRGYAFEVCSALLQYGYRELGFKCIQALVKKENHSSERVCQKLGFICEGVTELEGESYQRFIWKSNKSGSIWKTEACGL